jgi:predicted alpha/beta hydrolase
MPALSPAAKYIDLVVPARDGYPLAARLWAAEGSTQVALINGGAGIASTYYDRFAAFLAEEGIPTLVYDYRGIARSSPRRLRGFKASVEEWGSKDCAGMLDWLQERFPSARRIVVGHSVGGFLTGFAVNGELIDRMLLISAHTGYWGDYAFRARPSMYILWHLLMPFATSITGYFPARAFRLGEDLPAGVAKEWANRRRGDFWWNLRRADGSLDVDRRDKLLARFHNIRAHTLALRFTDDPFATETATKRILSLYLNATTSTLAVKPADINNQPIGHFGFFRRRMRATLWNRALAWLNLAGDSVSELTAGVGAEE